MLFTDVVTTPPSQKYKNKIEGYETSLDDGYNWLLSGWIIKVLLYLYNQLSKTNDLIAFYHFLPAVNVRLIIKLIQVIGY